MGNFGNTPAAYMTLGSRKYAKHNREIHDYYATDPDATNLFLDQLEKDGDIKLHRNIWEPACGEGHISKELEKRGYCVFSSDLYDRNYGYTGIDFLNQNKKPFVSCDIVTNPPYSIATEFVEKSLDLLNEDEYGIMHLRTLFLEGKSRYELFKENPPKYVYVHSTRYCCAMNGEFYEESGKKKGSAVSFAWFIWKKGFKGDTIIRWLK